MVNIQGITCFIKEFLQSLYPKPGVVKTDGGSGRLIILVILYLAQHCTYISCKFTGKLVHCQYQYIMYTSYIKQGCNLDGLWHLKKKKLAFVVTCMRSYQKLFPSKVVNTMDMLNITHLQLTGTCLIKLAHCRLLKTTSKLFTLIVALTLDLSLLKSSSPLLRHFLQCTVHPWSGCCCPKAAS